MMHETNGIGIEPGKAPPSRRGVVKGWKGHSGNCSKGTSITRGRASMAPGLEETWGLGAIGETGSWAAKETERTYRDWETQ